MALPFPTTDSGGEATREAIIRTELTNLTSENVDLATYRDYYEGIQKISYGTTKFQERFGSAFAGFRDNWCGVVCDAIADKLEVVGLQIGRGEDERKAWADTGKALWELMLDQDLDDKQEDLHTGVFVEGRSTAIVWPDPEHGFTLHWNPAQIVRVRYNDDNPDIVDWAVKRWQTPTGAIYVTYYTPTAVYKYIEAQGETPATRSDAQHSPVDQIPTNGGTGGLIKREVRGEEWPLANPLGVVPVIEFANKGARSELADVVPMQDSLNYMIEQMFVAGEFMAVPQRAVVTKQSEPVGGWINSAGVVWHFDPMVDSDGRFSMPMFHSFPAADPTPYIKIVEMFLQHIAFTTKTPLRYFFQSDRGGRGDAPSGESLKVEDKPLLDKVRKRAVSLGNRWYQLLGMVNKAVLLNPAKRVEIPYPGETTELPRGEMLWRDQRLEYRSAALADGAAMIACGLPKRFVWRQLGLTPDEYELAEELYEQEQEELVEKAREQAEMQAELAPEPTSGSKSSPSTDGIRRTPQNRSGPRPTNQ